MLKLFVLASKGGHAEIVASLLEAGVDKDLRDKGGFTAMLLAGRRCRQGRSLQRRLHRPHVGISARPSWDV